MTSVLILLSGFDPGTYFIEDDGIPNNGIAQLRSPDGSIIFFNIPTEFLTVTASAGRSVVINLTESFGTADINVGSLTDPSQNPDSITIASIRGAGDVLLASNGSITELGQDAASDINASTLILSAATGVGTGANALETQVGTLEAETTTGGINLANTGAVVIGGLTDNVNGLFVTTSGDLSLVNLGTITLNDETGFESIRGGNTSGNVTLTANGFDSDIRSTVDQDSIAAPGGSIFLTAGRDISFGTLGLNFDNDVRARGDLVITAGRDVNVDGFADLASDGFGGNTGGDVIVNAGRDVNVLNSTGTDASIGAEGSGGGNVTVNTGQGGFVRLLASSTSVLFSSSGSVNVFADRLSISATAGITASGGNVSLRPRTDGWAMDLGSATDGAFALEISDAELDRIFTPTLLLGSDNGGPVTISAAVSPASAPNVFINSGTNIAVNASITTTTSLTLRASDDVFQLAASTISTGTLRVFADAVNTDPGVGSSITMNGSFVTSTNTLNGNEDRDTINGNAANNNIFGFGENDILRGFGGADIIDGGTGVDTMEGGLGDDFFFVDNVGDATVEAIGEGNDRVFAGVSYVLAGGQSIEVLSTTNTAGTGAIDLTGNGFAQTIFGNEGINTLDSGGGGDIMFGLGGNDSYIIRSSTDRAIEAAGGGSDRVFAAVTFTLEPGSDVELITTTDSNGLAAINLSGNALTQAIVGNEGANTLDSGGGGDTMIGLGGNDFYFVRNASDRAVESVGGGTDRVFAGVSFTLEVGSEVETLGTVDTAAVTAINLTGNAFTQAIFGNAGVNILDSGGGGDTMFGFGGDDFYFVRSAGDRAIESNGGGNDRVLAAVSFTLEAGSSIETFSTADNAATTAINLFGNELVQSILGNAGANILDGKSGADTMTGLGGADTFAFTSGLGGGNIDVITDFVSGVDKIALAAGIFAGLVPGALPGSAFVVGTAAGDADDRIIYNNATGALLFDADGNGAGAAVQFATLQGLPAISASDFFVL